MVKPSLWGKGLGSGPEVFWSQSLAERGDPPDMVRRTWDNSIILGDTDQRGRAFTQLEVPSAVQVTLAAAGKVVDASWCSQCGQTGFRWGLIHRGEETLKDMSEKMREPWQLGVQKESQDKRGVPSTGSQASSEVGGRRQAGGPEKPPCVQSSGCRARGHSAVTA